MGVKKPVAGGPPRSMILFKPPTAPAPEHVRVLSTVDIVSKYRDGFFLATCSRKKLARLLETGAEVVVLDQDANRFVAETEAVSGEAFVALVDERLSEARSDMAEANADKGGSDDEGMA